MRLREALVALAVTVSFQPPAMADTWKPTEADMTAMGSTLDALAVVRKQLDAGEINLCAFVADHTYREQLSASVTGRSVTIKCSGATEPFVIEFASSAAQANEDKSPNDHLRICRTKDGGVLYARNWAAGELPCIESTGRNEKYKRETVRGFVTAWSILSRSWAAELPDEATLREQAKTLPPLTPDQQENLRRTQIQVELAIKENRLLDAAKLYRAALTATPAWAGGQFNDALLLADLEFYRAAIWAMRNYLALSPDAPDARAARDKMYEWEARLPPPAQ